MAAIPKDWITVVGGSVAMGALVFGAGLILLSSHSGASAAHQDPHEPASEKTEGEEGHAQKSESAHHEKSQGSGGHKGAEHGAKSSEEKHEKKEEAGPEKKPLKSEPATAAEVESWISKGESALVRGRYDDAREILTRAYKESPDNPRTMMRLADATLQSVVLPLQRRQEKAIELYARLVAGFPESSEAPKALLSLGKCYLESGRPEEGLQAFQECERRFPKTPARAEALIGKADCLMAQGNAQQTLPILESLLTEELPSAVRSAAEAKLANAKVQIARKKSGAEPPQTVKAEVIEVSAESPASAKPAAKPGTGPETKTAPDAKKESKPDPRSDAKDDECLMNIPDAQWIAVKRALEKRNIKEARRLLAPWLDGAAGDSAEAARQWLAWAQFLQTYASKGNSAQAKCDPESPKGAQ